MVNIQTFVQTFKNNASILIDKFFSYFNFNQIKQKLLNLHRTKPTNNESPGSIPFESFSDVGVVMLDKSIELMTLAREKIKPE